jgi:Raf kinase inhibitor-like YbhB/YbcL family protein
MRCGLMLLVACLALAGGCRRHSAPGGPIMPKITLTSAAYQEGQRIPARFTGEGDDVSPALSWSEPPAGAKEWALIMDDPDAPTSDPWVHWVMYKIPPATRRLPEGASKSAAAGVQGTNSFDETGYNGPYPPKGHGLHHYHLKVYALDQTLTLPPGATKEALQAAMAGHVLALGELVGVYDRK